MKKGYYTKVGDIITVYEKGCDKGITCKVVYTKASISKRWELFIALGDLNGVEKIGMYYDALTGIPYLQMEDFELVQEIIFPSGWIIKTQK